MEDFMRWVVKSAYSHLKKNGVRAVRVTRLREKVRGTKIAWIISSDRVNVVDRDFASELGVRLAKEIIPKIGSGKIITCRLELYEGVEQGALAQNYGLFIRGQIKRDGDLQIDCVYKGVSKPGDEYIL